MNQKELNEILEKHKKWLAGEPNGECAILRDCDLNHSELRGSKLSECDLSGSNLFDSDLCHSDLSYSNLSGCNLSGCNLRGSDLSNCDLSRSNMSGCYLGGSKLIDCDLSHSNMSGCYLSGCDLHYSDLSECDLSGSDLSNSDLSGCTGLVSPIQYMKENFERSADGYIAYKVFNAQYLAPGRWILQPGAVIEETVNANRTDDCGCGINVATLDWVDKNYGGEAWKVLIRWEWLPGVCVPYNTDGNIRCERVELIEIVQ